MPPETEFHAENATEAPEVRFVARQPIFDASRNLFAYELLFRDGVSQRCEARDGNAATLSTIDVSLLAGPESLTEGLPAFVNCTRETLVNQTVTTLPRDRVVLEILEEVESEPEVIAACEALRRSGYRLAVDDFDGDASRDRLIDLCEFIKVDFTLTTPDKRREIVEHYRRRGHAMLAEKVETQEEFTSAVEMGYRYFQGYFFCRPVTITTPDVRSLHPAYLDLMTAVYDQKFDVDAIERAIREEPSLCYRLLRYLNSAAFGVYPVRSIRHAISLLGQNELQKWVSVVTAIALAGSRSGELIRTSLHRAAFMEKIAIYAQIPHATEYFLAGVLSLMDAMLNQRMPVLLATLPVSQRVKDALSGGNNHIRQVLELAMSCERGNWEGLSLRCSELQMQENDAWAAFEAARRWAHALRTHLEER